MLSLEVGAIFQANNFLTLAPLNYRYTEQPFSMLDKRLKERAFFDRDDTPMAPQLDHNSKICLKTLK